MFPLILASHCMGCSSLKTTDLSIGKALNATQPFGPNALHPASPPKKPVLRKIASTQQENVTSVLSAVQILETSSSPGQRMQAAMGLSRFSQTQPELFTSDTVRTLTQALEEDQSWKVQFWSAASLGHLYIRPSLIDTSAIDALSDKLQHSPKKEVREGVARALGELASSPKVSQFITAHTIHVLEQVTGHDSHWAARKESAIALGYIGKSRPQLITSQVIHTLTKALQDPNESVQTWSAIALGDIGRTRAEIITKQTIKILTHNLSQNTLWEVRQNSAWALGMIGAAQPKLITREALKVLKAQSQNDTTENVRNYARQALHIIGAKKLKPYPQD